MITAGAYVLKVPERRREILLDDDARSWVNLEDPVIAESRLHVSDLRT
jgi:hypothetical protein